MSPSTSLLARWAGLLLLLPPVLTQAGKECIWEDQITKNDNIKAWEIQASPHRHQIRDRDKAIRGIERLLRHMSNDAASGVRFVEDSRWMSIFEEHAFMVSTRHGHPLDPEQRSKQDCPFPWRGLGYLRLRRYKLLVPAGAFVPTAMPGQADLTFKMKNLDPDIGPGNLQLPQEAAGARLTAKMENDVHCDHQRVSMSPLYRPVSQELNISRIGNVKQFYPNLAQVALLGEQQPLPFMHAVHRAKIVWTVLFGGVIGEANLVIKYNTTLNDAVAGARPKNGEISLRIRRDVAEATGTTGEEGKRALSAALDTLGRAMQAFRDAGWDGKTPALQPDKRHQPQDAAGSTAGGSDDGSSRLPRPLLPVASLAADGQAGAAAAAQQQPAQRLLWLLQPLKRLSAALQQLLPWARHTQQQAEWDEEQDDEKEEGCCCGGDRDRAAAGQQAAGRLGKLVAAQSAGRAGEAHMAW